MKGIVRSATARASGCLVVVAATLCSFGWSEASSAAPHINPVYGMPQAPPPSIPPECKKDPSDIIGLIDDGIAAIPDCGAQNPFVRKVCCAVATKKSADGCESIVATAMKCCRARFPIWVPQSVVNYACEQALTQMGVGEAFQYCSRQRGERLSDVGCSVNKPVTKPPRSTVKESTR